MLYKILKWFYDTLRWHRFWKKEDTEFWHTYKKEK